MARGSSSLLLSRKLHSVRLPYHKLDQIQEAEGDEQVDNLFESYQEDEEIQRAAAARVQALRSKMYVNCSRRSGSSAFTSSSSNNSSSKSYRSVGSSGYAQRRRTRWRRMRLRICRVRLISWLSPMEFLKKLRKAYIQAISSKEGQCGLVMMGSPWSFPVVIPFRGV